MPATKLPRTVLTAILNRRVAHRLCIGMDKRSHTTDRELPAVVGKRPLYAHTLGNVEGIRH